MSENNNLEYLKKVTLQITGDRFSEKASVQDYVDNLINYFTNIIYSMPNNVYWLDRNCVLRGGNNNLANQLNLKSGAELVGLTYEQMAQAANLPTQAFEPFRTTEVEVMKTGIPSIDKEEPPIKADGKIFYYLSSKTPLRNRKGEVIGVVGISTDITKLKETESALHIAVEKAEAANKAKTEFIMNMSHDLRTPLAGIIGISSIQADDATSPQERQYGKWIHSAGEQLLELLNSVIEVTAAEHQIESVKKEHINLQQFAEELQALMQPAMVAKGLEFQIKLDTHLPIVITDRIKLKRIILNLLSNAVKFTKQGKICLEINALKVKNDEAKIEIFIADTGIGIAKNKIDKIFDRFYRAHPSFQAEYTGYGIGLYLVKKTADLLGGKITVSSEEGKGSCFALEFTFPLAEENAEQIVCAILKPSSLKPHSEIDNHSVLVAEDNTLVLHVVKNLLSNLGYDVTTVTDGKAALHALQTQYFHWALLDIGLPNLAGTEVAKLYRQWEKEHNKPRLPLFALTAHAVDEVKEKCDEVGIDYILNKPFTDKDVQIIELFMENKE
jgi:two-component system, OmpR family, aerobic respiration control sensor histidine kinase ArcB